MRTSMRVIGIEDLLKDINIASEKMDDVVEGVIEDVAFRTQEFAIRGIQRGPATGRVYTGRGRTHQASAAGEFPMSDTGRLAASVEVEIRSKTFRSVGTNVFYGPHLEFGTAKMAPRPWLTPSFEQAIEGVVRDAKKRYVQKFGGQ